MKKVLAKSYVFIILILLYAPLLLLFVFSFNSSLTIGSWTGGVTFELYRNLFTGRYASQIGEALTNTLIISVASSLLSVVLGTLAAIGIQYMRPKAKSLLNTLSRIPLMNAEIVSALCFMLFFSLIHLQTGYLTVILAHTTFCTPYVLLNVQPKLQQMNKHTYEAAVDLGATPLQAMRKVVLPEIMPGIISGGILAFTVSIDDFVITQFTIGEFETLATFIYNTAGGKKPLPPELRALSVLIFVTVLLILFAVNRFSAKAQRAKEATA